jgi:hypothetical protein
MTMIDKYVWDWEGMVLWEGTNPAEDSACYVKLEDHRAALQAAHSYPLCEDCGHWKVLVCGGNVGDVFGRCESMRTTTVRNYGCRNFKGREEG